ncbi:Cu-Zn superoxide dismutase [Pontibacillus halophilus JSM 076056 = DSM 19796]|uniref:Superoxide dismutase [Cu-Zn] n=1 Tax=Pontibacillus halophilus JSM 076056 = DSM 19796 TaxID=1385510 RepID=A0A0A5GC71_9BACI|nr:superoxide dismutase family protein [Pontibacillus halophilus]KGX89604.1 Cu-Zn superoxide dismutase [Pontibacillus halophilus JSM 076056 = DSM 19796]
MKKRYVSAFLTGVLVLGGCMNENRSSLEVQMYNASGDAIGTATLGEQSDGVGVKVSVTGLKPGLHGIHIHEFAKCEGPDFKTAGNHFNPDGKLHGLMNPEGAHVGDLPNIEADGSGLAEAELVVQGATMKDGKKSLLRDEGTSIIIHENQDDGVSQPGGNAGERIACGVISMKEKNGENPPSDPTETGDQKEKES